MNTSGEAADQVVRMSLEVGEAALKISGAGAKQLAVLLYAILKEQKKTRGRARLETLVRSGRPLTVFSVRDMIEHDCGADAVLRRHVSIETDLHVSASKRQYPVAIADTTGYFYIFPATRAEKAKLSGSAINLDTEDTPFGDGMHMTRRFHISTTFVVR